VKRTGRPGGQDVPTLEDDGWELDDAEARHAEAPDSFQIPSREERTGLRVGDMVKLLFLFLNRQDDGSPIIDCERMWVTVLEVAGGRYTGQLESLPYTSKALAPLDTIHFGPEHVAAVFVRKNDPRHPHFGIGE
jgi:hypothetical protein